MIIAGILSPLENVLTAVLEFLHESVGLPWAWSIVALTVIVRMLLVPLTVRQIHSMQNLQRHAPQMKEIQRKYKGDRQKLNEELMKFYRENRINPASSCLPLLAQFPVFISLYFVLKDFEKEVLPRFPESTLGWLHLVPNITDNAGSHWSGFVLLAIYATSQTASTLLMSTTMDRTQRTLLLFLPLVFLFVVINFPAGLILYWMTTNLWTVGQGLITRRLVPKTPAPQKRTSRTPSREEREPREREAAQTPPPEPVEAERSAAPATDGPAQVRRVKRKKKRKARR
ncbi:MAG: YidC/Oxa1 family membrane protein insertase [Actinomycetota bacterium]|nr:YidC/Oxa1 family membrane protein insertase [Actinomycetota bacterium]